jgi:hypothetical protein
VLLYAFFVLFYVFVCVVLCDACFVAFPVLFVCICVLNNCHRVATQLQLNIYRVSQEEGIKLREGVPYVKLYRKNPKHLYPKLNGLGDNGQ